MSSSGSEIAGPYPKPQSPAELLPSLWLIAPQPVLTSHRAGWSEALPWVGFFCKPSGWDLVEVLVSTSTDEVGVCVYGNIH